MAYLVPFRSRVRASLARSLRKWADLIDPHLKPSHPISIRVSMDTSELDEGLKRLQGSLKTLQDSFYQAKREKEALGL